MGKNDRNKPGSGMIVSASRRTDIPAWYGDWMARRLGEGYAMVRNPFNPRQVRRVSLKPEQIAGLVFWTRYPAPFLKHLDRVESLGAPFYFQFTLTGYGPDLEPGMPSLEERINSFRRLSERVGSGRVLWRYDPVLLSPGYGCDFHLRTFDSIASLLESYTVRCTISFLDLYRKNSARLNGMRVRTPGHHVRRMLAAELSAIARSRCIQMVSCAEGYLQDVVEPGACVDSVLLAESGGRPVPGGKDPGQRRYCRCAPSVDIGAYDSCPYGCVYCYANRSRSLAARTRSLHRVGGEFLIG
jgi:hypothetical protein